MHEHRGPRTPDELLLGFTRALRAAGLPVTADRSHTFLRAVAALDLGDRCATYWAGRATLCTGPEDFAPYDQVFSAWFLEEQRAGTPRQQQPLADRHRRRRWTPARADAGDGDQDAEVLRVAASDLEVLRHRDIARLDAGRAGPPRRAVRGAARPAHRRARRTAGDRPRAGSVDAHATLRRTLPRMGEPVEIAHRHRSTRPRRTVLLVDVSGSMSGYVDALLRLAHRMSAAGPTEVFSVGTRVTRLTRAMRLRDPDRAIVGAGETVPDWSGGTRLGEGLQVLLDRWGQRGLVRGAVVVRLQRRLGARRRERCSASRCRGCTGSRTTWCG